MKKLLFILIFFQSSAFSQEYFHYDLNVESGLPSNAVYDIHFSKEGFLFIGTNRGLAKYDGKKVETLPIGNDKMSITGFEEDEKGTIYFLSFSGLLWEYNGDSIREIKRLKGLFFPTMALLNQKELIFCGNNGYGSYDPQTREIKEYPLSVDTSKSGKSQSIVMASVRNGVIVKLRNKLFRIDAAHKSWAVKTDKSVANYTFCIEWKERTVLVGRSEKANGNNIALSEIVNDRVIPLKEIEGLDYRDLLSVECDDNGLYFLTRNGYQYLSALQSKPVTDKNLVGKNISKLIKTKQDALYIATLENGIKIIPNVLVKDAKDNFPNEGIGNLFATDGRMYFTANDGYCRTAFPKGVLNGIKLDIPVSVKVQSDGNLIFNSTKQKYLYDVSAQKATKIHINYGMADISSFPKEKKLITSTKNGLSLRFKEISDYENAQDKYSKFSAKSLNRFDNKLNPFGIIDLLDGISTHHYYNTKDSSLYSCVNAKVVHIYNDGTIKYIKNGSEHLNVSAMAASSDGSMYMNNAYGVLKIVNDKVAKNLESKQGLLQVNWQRIKTQGDTLILIGDELVQVYKESMGVIVTYATTDFLPKSALLDAAIYNGKLFISSAKGVYELPLKPIHKPKPRAFIRYLKAGETRWSQNKSIPFSENSLVFKIAGNSIANRGAFHYEYNLQGAGSSQWIEQDANFDMIRFSALTEGDYKLRLKVVAVDGGESEIVEYKFSIKPPFTRSMLFYFLCFLFILGILGLIFWLRLRALRRVSEFDKQVKQSEITAIKAQMNPHFVFNALNSIQNWVLLNDVENSNKYLGKFSDLVRKTLETSEENEVALIKEIEIIELYLELENLRFEDEININLDVKISKEDQETMLIPAMLIQPYIENVFKHGLLHKKGMKELNVLFEVRNEKLFCQIEDNGVGITRSQELNKRNKKYKSFSTVANRKRIDLLNDMFNNEIELTIEDAFPEMKDCGTRVIIWLPISNNYSHS